jgi:hypothetical protein
MGTYGKIKWLTFRRRRPACSFSVTELCVRKFRTGQWCRQSRMGLGLPALVQYCLQQSATKGLSWNSIRPTGQPWRGCVVVMNGDKWCTERRSTRASARHSLLSKWRIFYGSCLSVVIIYTHKKIAAFSWADFHESCRCLVALRVELLNRTTPKAGDKCAL